MIEKKDIVEIGKFQKTHALRGELNAILHIPEEYVEDGNPLVLEVDGIFVPFYAESIRPKGSTSYLIKLEGINTQEEAQEVVNSLIYAPKAEVEEYIGDEEGEVYFNDDLAGYRVVDEALGEIGVVERVDDSTDNVLLVVESSAGDEVFIPFVESFIREIDDEGEEIICSLPEGLVELNVKKNAD